MRFYQCSIVERSACNKCKPFECEVCFGLRQNFSFVVSVTGERNSRAFPSVVSCDTRSFIMKSLDLLSMF